ncbi:MAG TPA: helix-turn-helix domain-containing protein [Solirubrobacteraceae bacterium]|nr:helix-turn-helix domain-containing protein [Solirubrobacteraceae bacterium]
MRREELLEVGLRLFSDRAYDELLLDDIAAEAGVAKGLIHYYFGSKRGFYVAIVEAAAREMRGRFDLDASRPPGERLRQSIDAYLLYAEEHSAGYRTLLGGGIGSDPEVLAIRDAERAFVLDLILGGLGLPGDPPPALRMALEGWLSFVEGVSLEWLVHRDLERDQVRDLLVTALAGALTAACAVDPGLEVDPAVVTR